MVPKSGEEDLVVTSGIRKYPTNRDSPFKTAENWLEGKRKDDGVYPYWRVHNKLYDLTEFISNHPGGTFWIEETRGTDITESFESSHFGTVPERVLKKYYVKDIHTPRNSPFTFHENGFYKTLKRRVSPILKKVGTGPSLSMFLIQDFLFVGFLIFSTMAARYSSYSYAVITGAFMSLMANAAHNFFHQKDNWHMLIFDFTLSSSKDWRITHVLSHHNFPNTIVDYEVSCLEPHLEFFPRRKKSLFRRYAAILISSILYALGFSMAFAYRIILYKTGKTKLVKENILPFLHLFFIMGVCGSIFEGLKIWLVMQFVMSFVFMFIGLTASHHHPQIYHEGDRHLDDKDWGLHQLIATKERGELFVSNLFLASVSFGNHTLHHLFPTVDHSKLPYLQEVFKGTCGEFGVEFDAYTPWDHLKGCYQQLASVTPNAKIPTIFKNNKNKIKMK